MEVDTLMSPGFDPRAVRRFRNPLENGAKSDRKRAQNRPNLGASTDLHGVARNLSALYRAIWLRFGYGFESCDGA